MQQQGNQIIVHGHVQQVGFRFATALQAERLNITGHAVNLANGDVEVCAYGNKYALDELIVWLRNGPETAQVNALEITSIDYLKCADFTCD